MFQHLTYHSSKVLFRTVHSSLLENGRTCAKWTSSQYPVCHGCILIDCRSNRVTVSNATVMKDSLEAVGPRFFVWCEMLLGFCVGNRRFKIYTPLLPK